MAPPQAAAAAAGLNRGSDTGGSSLATDSCPADALANCTAAGSQGCPAFNENAFVNSWPLNVTTLMRELHTEVALLQQSIQSALVACNTPARGAAMCTKLACIGMLSKPFQKAAGTGLSATRTVLTWLM
jgi:hypothetical protein